MGRRGSERRAEGGHLNATEFISRLDKVKSTAQGEWVACCPAHADKSPSLAVKETHEGRILIHCFAGCSFEEVCAGAGVKPEELFPDTDRWKGREMIALKPLPFNPRTVLKALAFNATILAVLAADIAAGKEISLADKETAFKIREEFEEAVDAITR
jgi:hypothetical protein